MVPILYCTCLFFDVFITILKSFCALIRSTSRSCRRADSPIHVHFSLYKFSSDFCCRKNPRQACSCKNTWYKHIRTNLRGDALFSEWAGAVTSCQEQFISVRCFNGLLWVFFAAVHEECRMNRTIDNRIKRYFSCSSINLGRRAFI